jgi:hypothetical protein
MRKNGFVDKTAESTDICYAQRILCVLFVHAQEAVDDASFFTR